MSGEARHMLRPGGVMRCCIATLEKRALSASPPAEGEKLPCDYCSASLVYRDGAWEWDHAAPPVVPLVADRAEPGETDFGGTA